MSPIKLRIIAGSGNTRNVAKLSTWTITRRSYRLEELPEDARSHKSAGESTKAATVSHTGREQTSPVIEQMRPALLFESDVGFVASNASPANDSDCTRKDVGAMKGFVSSFDSSSCRMRYITLEMRSFGLVRRFGCPPTANVKRMTTKGRAM